MEKDIKKLRRKLKDIEFEIKNLDKSYYLSKTNIMENEEKIERMEESMKKVIGPLTTLVKTYLKKKYNFIDDVEVKYTLRLPESFTYYAIDIKIKLQHFNDRTSTELYNYSILSYNFDKQEWVTISDFAILNKTKIEDIKINLKLIFGSDISEFVNVKGNGFHSEPAKVVNQISG